MRGNNPNDWPRNIEDFSKEITNLPWNAFASEPEVFLEDFLKTVHTCIKNMATKLKNVENKVEMSKHLITAIEILLSIVMRTNNQTFILQNLKQLFMLPISEVLDEKSNYTLIRNL